MNNRFRGWWVDTPRAQRWASLLLILFLFARISVVRVIYVHPERALFAYDTRYYLELAHNLLADGTFEAPSYPEQSLVRTPGYAAFLAVIFKLFGDAPYIVVLIQLLITIGTCGLVYAIGKCLGGNKAGLVAGWVYAINPNSFFWGMTILSGTLFSFLLTFASYHFLRFIQKSRGHNLVLSGALLGLATLVRPVGLLVIFIWVLLLTIWQFRSTGQKRAMLVHVGLFTVASTALILPWFIRNYVKHGEFTLGTSGSVTFDAYHLAATLASAKDISIEDARYEIAVAEDQVAFRKQILVDYPLIFIQEQAYGTAKTVMGIEHGFWMQMFWGRMPESSGVLVNLLRGDIRGFFKGFLNMVENSSDLLNLILILIGAGHSLVMFGLVMMGVIRGLKSSRQNKLWVILMVLTVVYIVVVPGARGASRFRIAADPGFATLAGLSQIKGEETKGTLVEQQ
jgi:4-amino-4-deoxy-L-arabinose transferase-like glycosyltransferase